MKILILNAGSSSLKYQLFDMESGEVLAKGLYIWWPHDNVINRNNYTRPYGIANPAYTPPQEVSP